jgi:hypothetical protein
MSNIPGYGKEGEILWRAEDGSVRDEDGRVVTRMGDRFFPVGEPWMAPPVTAPETSREIVPELWEKCAVIWQNLVIALGGPIDLVRWIFIWAKTHRAIGNWVRHLEELVRRAVLIDALTRAPPVLKPRRKARQRPGAPASPKDMPRFRSASRYDPSSWRVSFRMEKPKRGCTPHRRRHGERSRFNPRALRRSRPYALRIEALRRVIQYREHHVQRHARRLARLAEDNRRANDPRELSIPPFDYQPKRRSIGMHAVIPYLPRANLVAWREIALWNARNAPAAKHIEPG